MILFHKDLNQIAEETLADLESAGIQNTSPGDMVRILLATINKQLGTYYTTLRDNHVQAFVSQATGERLDLIGVLLQCTRYSGESDDNYRYRITKQIQSVATANETAVRLAILSVPGVQEVMLKPFTHGTGSFSAYIISDMVSTPEYLLTDVDEVLKEVKALGIRSEVMRPIIKEVEVKIRVIFDKKVREFEKALIIESIRSEISDYLNGLHVGEELIFDEFERIARSHSEFITGVTVFDMRINERSIIPKNIKPAWNERFVESGRQNAVMVI